MFQRVANEQIGPTDFLFTHFDTEAKQAVHNHTVVGNDFLEIQLFLAQIKRRCRLLDRVAGTPFVAVTGVEDDPHSGVIANFEVRATGNRG